ncbi:hypothetical protein LZ009_03095 [Ramlibacter sp. XY19]|uniref:hypothetical protein n=1 Tax=Ramlibacter paludis TaxID=2908000 RepID=UPI0023D98E81|nr:hypothetical protein [Ramlibacter paludis]MCG2591760.1 hypothetical protein [Ramlibacter paludis]
MSPIRHSMLNLLSGLVLVAAVGGCGGGEELPAPTSDTGKSTPEANPAPPTLGVADAYAGTWRACFPMTQDGGSSAEQFVFERTGAGTATFRFNVMHFAAPGCQGSGSVTQTDAASVSFVGVKTVSGETVHKAIFSRPGGSHKEILVIRADGKLYVGSDPQEAGYRTDVEGFPDTLSSVGYERQ